MDSVFVEYLRSKKIDSDKFRLAEPEMYVRWEKEFANSHPNSFTAQKLYKINPIRRSYPLKETEKKVESKSADPAAPNL
jgi:hypothetical protein